MASDIKRRTEKLERVRSNRQKAVVFEAAKGDVDAQVAAYEAITPKGERAKLYVIIRDLTGGRAASGCKL